MSDSAEYNRLVRKRSSLRAKIRASQDRIDGWEDILSRLRPAKTEIVQLKADFEVVKKNDNANNETGREWQGDNRVVFNGMMSGVISINETYYKGSLDHVLDSINNEITRIENLINNEWLIIGNLKSALNSVLNAIENFFN